MLLVAGQKRVTTGIYKLKIEREGEKDCSLNLKHTQAASTYIFGFNGQARAATESEESVNWI